MLGKRQSRVYIENCGIQGSKIPKLDSTSTQDFSGSQNTSTTKGVSLDTVASSTADCMLSSDESLIIRIPTVKLQEA